jgi:hypothetical protein
MASDITKSRIAVGAAATITLALVGWTWQLSEAKARLEGKMEAHAAMLADHETRMRTVESGFTEMRADVKWIRVTLERRGTP